jgi:hypothetical protein
LGKEEKMGKVIDLSARGLQNPQLPPEVVRIYSFDPGVTTGFADCLVDTANARLLVRNGLELKELSHLSFIFHPALFTQGGQLLFPTQVLCEKVANRTQGFNEYAIEVMGMIRLLTDSVGLPCLFRPPGMMEAARRRHELREIRSNHVRDATHHAIAFAYESFQDIIKGTLEVEVEETVVKRLKSEKARIAATTEYFRKFTQHLQGMPPKVEI